MPRLPKQDAWTAFQDNIKDADILLSYAKGFTNNRKYSMRKELKDSIGDALHINVKSRDKLNCIDSGELFVVFRPDANLQPSDFVDLRPILRQVLVAVCSAFETYIADKVMEHVSTVIKADNRPSRLEGIPLTLGRWLDVERRYKRRGWGVRAVIEEFIRETSSTASNKVGEVLSIIGVKSWAKRVDDLRRTPKGTTVEHLDALTRRRNLIAHAADRKGQGRATLEYKDVVEHVTHIRDIASAIEQLLSTHTF